MYIKYHKIFYIIVTILVHIICTKLIAQDQPVSDVDANIDLQDALPKIQIPTEQTIDLFGQELFTSDVDNMTSLSFSNLLFISADSVKTFLSRNSPTELLKNYSAEVHDLTAGVKQ